jgi:hypothetical protein
MGVAEFSRIPSQIGMCFVTKQAYTQVVEGHNPKHSDSDPDQ